MFFFERTGNVVWFWILISWHVGFCVCFANIASEDGKLPFWTLISKEIALPVELNKHKTRDICLTEENKWTRVAWQIKEVITFPLLKTYFTQKESENTVIYSPSCHMTHMTYTFMDAVFCFIKINGKKTHTKNPQWGWINKQSLHFWVSYPFNAWCL